MLNWSEREPTGQIIPVDLRKHAGTVGPIVRPNLTR